MELPSLDKQCNEYNCNRLDFLPLQCKCGKKFCSDHFNAHVQLCEKSKFISEEELKKIENAFVCSYSSCKKRSVVPLVCERCKNHFCIQHRHLQECTEKDKDTIAAEKEKYAAPERQFKEVKASIDQKLDNKLMEAKNKAKHRNMANKVQLMRIKNKAVGQKSIPVMDRVYFNVVYPKNERTVPVFVSKQWTLGRAVDEIAKELKLVNNNNKINEKKLRLFKKENNEIVSSSMSTGLTTLLENDLIVDGEELIIELVDNNCVKLS